MLRSRLTQVLRPRCLRVFVPAAFNSTQAASVNNNSIWKPFISSDLPDPIGDASELDYDAQSIMNVKKRRIALERSLNNKRTKHGKPVGRAIEGSNEEILAIEVHQILEQVASAASIDNASSEATTTPDPSSSTKLDLWSEHVVEVIQLSSTGDGLAYGPTKDHIFVVPFTVPGDIVVAKIHKMCDYYSLSDLVKVIEPSPRREGATPKCKYFGTCSGCQLQMLPYQDQLAHKKTIVENAFKHFSFLPPEKVPAVLDTMGSPLQYGYRTKLTPHFTIPTSHSRGKPLTAPPSIGFNMKGRNKVLDIESCPIGTDILQEGMTIQRRKVTANYSHMTKGATICLRESTERVTQRSDVNTAREDELATSDKGLDYDSPFISKELQTQRDGAPEYKTVYPTHTDYSTYVTDERNLTTEYIGPYRFDNRAGSFFQNNNSILRPFTKYVYDNCIAKKSATPGDSDAKPIKYLLDAYCGSGLFTIALSPIFSSALGIDIDHRGIEAAIHNARINGIKNAGFISADATDLFADVPYPRDQSLVVIDPPRKGASVDFLKQLCKFGPKRVVYVSCNVHTQARDVGMIVSGFPEGSRYEIESLKGFDFFPQTGHVEGVCVLNRVDEGATDPKK